MSCYKLFIFTLCGHTKASHTPVIKRTRSNLPKPSRPAGTSTAVSPLTSSPDLLHTGIIPSAWELEVSQSIPDASVPVQQPLDVNVGTDTDSATSQIYQPSDLVPQLRVHPYQTYLLHTLCQQCTSARAHRLAKIESSAIKSDLDGEVHRKSSRSRAEQQLRRVVESKYTDSVPGTEAGVKWRGKELKLVVENLDRVEANINHGVSKGFVWDRVRDGLLEWSSSMTMAPKTDVGTENSVNASTSARHGVTISALDRYSGDWLNSPRLRKSLNVHLSLVGGLRDPIGRDEDLLKPEHFAVSSMLHGSSDSLTTDGNGASRRVSGDGKVDRQEN